MGDYSQTVLPLLRELRPILLPQWGQAKVIDQKGPSAVNIVTELDIEVEQLVARKLKQLYPDIGFFGEELGSGSTETKTDNRFWLMDPIDGTQHFIRGLPFCTTMLALVERGAVTFSAIYDFIKDDMYWATKGGGAFRNDGPIHVSSRPLNQAYFCYESRLDKQENLDTFMRLRKKAVTMKTISAGWDFCMIASGKLEGRICFDPFGQPYDFAPGCLLVAEAGGVVANIGSAEYDYRNVSFIASNSVVFKQLTQGPDAVFPQTKANT
jgi:myo-inositol-1(or 4)-monophosphatase